MKLKKQLGIILITGVLSVMAVGCSSPGKEKVEKGNATSTEEKKTSEAPPKEEKKEEVVLVDDDTAKISVLEKVNDEIFGPKFKFLIENKSDQKIIVQSRDTSIDGTMEEPVFSVEVTPGKKANGEMSFINIEDINNLKNLEGKLVILDENFGELQSSNIQID